jgi:AcrR family transcriptional regulator
MKRVTNVGERRRNTRGKGDLLRGDIIAAAIRVLERLGPEDPFSLRAVAKESGIAAPSVYIHFADRDALLHAVLDHLYADLVALRAAAEEKAALLGGGAWEQLIAASFATISFGLERPGHYRVIYEGRIMPRLADQGRMAFATQLQARTIELIRNIAIKGPKRRVEDPTQMSMLLWAAIHGLISFRINKPDLPWPDTFELAENMLRVLIRPAKQYSSSEEL